MAASSSKEESILFGKRIKKRKSREKKNGFKKPGEGEHSRVSLEACPLEKP